MDKWTEQACDTLDACVFSGEACHDADTRAMLREFMASWERAMKAWEALEDTNNEPQS